MYLSRCFVVSLFLSFFVCLAFLGLACLAWRCLPLLALLVVLGVVQRCLFFAWCYLALLGFVDVACLAWHCLALLGTVWHCFALLRVACLAWPCRLSVLVAPARFCSLTRFPFSACPVDCGWVGDWVGRHRGGPFFYPFSVDVFFGF